jgi:hypothetical protein
VGPSDHLSAAVDLFKIRSHYVRPAGTADSQRFGVAELPSGVALVLTVRAAATPVEHRQAEQARRQLQQ